jgi:hypothetical protein
LIQGAGLPGFPVYTSSESLDAFLPVHPGIDALNNIAAAKNPGDPNVVGESNTPFPQGNSGDQPGGFAPQPSAKDTVLRTGALNLSVAAPGTLTSGSSVPADASGVEGTQHNMIGKSGGQANLFGKIPGKDYGIDITVSLATRINSVLRILNQDPFGGNLHHGDNYPAGVFNCRQVWTGAVQNYITGVRLAGDLKISPAITSDGKLRIAKATVSTPPNDSARVGLAACLAPYASYESEHSPTSHYSDPIPTDTGLIPESKLPVDVNAAPRPAPNADCNTDPTYLVKHSALGPDTVNSLTGGTAGGYTTTGNGSQVSVSGDLAVNKVEADVLIGN